MNNFDVTMSDKKSSITCFEDLSNDIFYDILDYLDTCDSYEAFYDLNSRFQNIFLHLSLPYKINFSLISKRIFDKHFQNLIIPNKHRLISLHLSNFICLDHFSFDSSFLRLESLIINEIKFEKILPLFKTLVLLPRLFSLSMTTNGIIKDPNTIHELIFTLPVLKYCKTAFQCTNEYIFSSSSIEKISPIEYFINKSEYNLSNLMNILCQMPRLTHLSCSGCSLTYALNMRKPITLNNLRYFHLESTMSLDAFERFMSNIFHRIEVLRITSRSNKEYLDSNRWKQLILTSFPCLHTFDLQYFGKTLNDTDEFFQLFDGFISPFWIERKWFFDHRTYKFENTNWIVVYSVKQTYSFEQINMDFLRHIVIENDTTTIDLCPSELTVSDPTLYIDRLDPFIVFEKLNKLTVTASDANINQLMIFLSRTPNIKILVLDTSSFPFPENQINNNIQQIVIRTFSLTFETIQRVITTFPNLKSLEMRIDQAKLEFIIRFILKHSMKNNSYLNLLTFQDSHSAMISRIQKVIDREELLPTYSIQYTLHTACLWW